MTLATDPEAVHTYTLELTDGFQRSSSISRSYKGLEADARRAALRWFTEEPEIQRIVSESGEVIAERL